MLLKYTALIKPPPKGGFGGNLGLRVIRFKINFYYNEGVVKFCLIQFGVKTGAIICPTLLLGL